MDQLIQRLTEVDINQNPSIPQSWLLHASNDALLVILNSIPHEAFKNLSRTCKRLYELAGTIEARRDFVHHWDNAVFSPVSSGDYHPLDLVVEVLTQPHLARLLTNLSFDGRPHPQQNWVPGRPLTSTINRLSEIVPLIARELRNSGALTPQQQTVWVRNAIRIRRGDVSIILVLALCSNLRMIFLSEMSPEMIRKLDRLLNYRYFTERSPFETLPGFSGSIFNRLQHLRLHGDRCFGGLTSKLLLLPTLRTLTISGIDEEICNVVLGQVLADPMDLTECQIEKVRVWHCMPWPSQLALFLKHLPKLKRLWYNFGDYPTPTSDFDMILATYVSIVQADPSSDTTHARRSLAAHPTFIQRQLDPALEYMSEFEQALDDHLPQEIASRATANFVRSSSDVEVLAPLIGIQGQFNLIVNITPSNEQI